MKKKLMKQLVALGMVLCMGAAFVGCEKDEEEGKKPADNRTTYEILSELDIEEYVTLGEYKGIEVENVEVGEVTEKEIQASIDEALQAFPFEVTDRTKVEKGDTVNIDYVGRMDGETFSGGAAEGQDLVIGSNMFIDGFEKGLIGKNVGETCVLELSFPDPYPNNPDFAGKPVEFTVTINSISAPLDEPTDAWVAENVTGCKTVAEYKELLVNALKMEKEATAEEQLKYNAWTKVVEACTVKEPVEVLVERHAAMYKADVKAYAAAANMSFEDYVEYCQVSMEEFEELATEYGKSMAGQTMISYAICEAEGFKLGDDSYKQEMKEIAELQGMTEEKLIETYGQDDMEQTVLLNLVCELLINEAELVEAESSEAE